QLIDLTPETIKPLLDRAPDTDHNIWTRQFKSATIQLRCDVICAARNQSQGSQEDQCSRDASEQCDHYHSPYLTGTIDSIPPSGWNSTTIDLMPWGRKSATPRNTGSHADGEAGNGHGECQLFAQQQGRKQDA